MWVVCGVSFNVGLDTRSRTSVTSSLQRTISGCVTSKREAMIASVRLRPGRSDNRLIVFGSSSRRLSHAVVRR